jgi:hypothetical protein
MLTADAAAAHVPSRTVSVPRISRVPGVLRCALVSSAYQAAPTEATILHEQTLAGRPGADPGPGHPGTLTSRNGLTVACQGAGRTAEAKGPE